MRFLPAITVLALLVSGCGKGDSSSDEGGDDDDDDDVVTETIHTGVVDLPKRAAEVRFTGFVSWDAGTREVVAPIIDGDPNYISVYVISLYEEGWSYDRDDSYCRVRVELTGLTQSTTAISEGYVWGIDIPAATLPMDEDCIEKGFDPDQWTDGDPMKDWGALDWQLRIGGTKTDELNAWLIKYLSPSDGTPLDLDLFAAGSWATTVASDSYNTDPDSNYWQGNPMDSEHNVDLAITLTEAEMNATPGALPSGRYVFDQRVYWTLSDDTE